ncbi:hypothetical protein VTH06DRAFT_1666 [Thermothelomyces fergusii]
MTPAPAPIIPRFLLPQTGLIWRRAAPGGSTPASVLARNPPVFLRLSRRSSTTTGSSSNSSNPSGQRVLAKPERFNPPSHGSRLPKKSIPRHYGGDLSFEEAKAQASRDYPGLPPPPTTFAHWFLHSRWIHVVITVGTLTGLAIYTFALSFQRTSPFADMLPPASEYLYHPVRSVRLLVEVLRLHEAHKAERISEKRRRNVEDVAKRAAYRRAHGLPEEMGLFNQPMAKIATAEDGGDGAAQKAAEASGHEDGADGGDGEPKGTGVKRLTEEERKVVVENTKGRWLGIF